MGVTFTIERFAEIEQEAQALAVTHWAETESSMYGEREYILDSAQYRALEAAGMLHIVTARSDGALVGYASFFVTYNQHIAGMMGSLDGLFMAREHRGHSGIKLLRFALESLKVCGLALVQLSAPESNAKVGKIYERLGAALTETVYTLRFK